MLYFDHAATSFPKPESVYLAHDAYLRAAGNPGRGAHDLAVSSARTIFESRATVADFCGVANSERLVFTSSCTHSINAVIKGCGLQSGDCVVTSSLEHNAVMRPLRSLEKSLGIRVVVLPYAQRNILDVADLVKAIESERPKLCVFTEASNVTGEKLQANLVASICEKYATPLLLDAAQTAGSEGHCLTHSGITFWAAPAHKGLMGAPGLGLLFIRDSARLAPLIEGGTGSGSESFDMPGEYPDHLEAGTQAGSAIAALGAGVESITRIGASEICKYQSVLATTFKKWCANRDWIQIYGRSYTASDASLEGVEYAPIVSFQMENRRADQVADLLNTQFGIAVRSGLHCAALAHQSLGTLEVGLVRASFGLTNTIGEVEKLCDALDAIHQF